MRTKPLIVIAAIVSGLLATVSSQAVEIAATGSGNWSSTVPDAPWPDGIVPGTNESVNIEAPFVVTVDSTASAQFIYGSGTVIMAPDSTLTIDDPAGGQATYQLEVLDASATGNTIIYSRNPFWAKHQDYYNLVFIHTGTNQVDFFNGLVNSMDPAYPMTIAGDMTVIGKIKVQQGDNFTINGNLLLGTNATWDCSSHLFTVKSNTIIGGLMLDLNGALGSNYFGGDVTVTAGGIGWNVSDVTHWTVAGSLTNNGTMVGKGYGSISFDGTGSITGSKPIQLPTITVNGNYQIGTTITLVTNTPTLNGTLVFDLASTNRIVLLTNAGTALFYSGNLEVINSGAAPIAGSHYKLFTCTNGFGGAFASTNLPSLGSGLTWVDNLLTTGSLDVIGGSVGSPLLSLSRSGGNISLSWDSAAFPGYIVQGQTNTGGISTNWGPASGGAVSPFVVPVEPSNKSVFFRLFKP